MKNNKIKILINLFIIINTLLICINGYKYGASSGQVGDFIIGINYFMPYTIESNIFMAIICLVELIQKKNNRLLNILSLMSTVSISITFIVVVIFLTPSLYISNSNPLSLYLNDMLFFHVLNPILSVINFIFYKNNKLSKKDYIYGLIPAFIYSIVYLINVLFTKKWVDIYNFTFNGRYYLIPLVMISIYTLAIMVSKLLIKLKK